MDNHTYRQRSVESSCAAATPRRRSQGCLASRSGGLLSLVLVLASVGGLFWAKSALASSGASSVPLGDYAGWVNAIGHRRLRVRDQHAPHHGHRLPRPHRRVGRHGQRRRRGRLDRHRATASCSACPSFPAWARWPRAPPAPTTSTSPRWRKNLVAEGQGNAILRLGWEFNGDWYPWSVANNTDAAELRRLLDPDRQHHAGRARRPVPVPVEPQPGRPHQLEPDRRPIPGTPMSTTSAPTSTTSTGARPRPRRTRGATS